LRRELNKAVVGQLKHHADMPKNAVWYGRVLITPQDMLTQTASTVETQAKQASAIADYKPHARRLVCAIYDLLS